MTEEHVDDFRPDWAAILVARWQLGPRAAPLGFDLTNFSDGTIRILHSNGD